MFSLPRLLVTLVQHFKVSEPRVVAPLWSLARLLEHIQQNIQDHGQMLDALPEQVARCVGLVSRAERVTGIEPASSAWEADVLPLNHTRVCNFQASNAN